MSKPRVNPLAILASLEEEGGITEVSLRNAAAIIKDLGMPMFVVCIEDEEEQEYYVIATWPDALSFCFTGFSWGYKGEGPTGLMKFFEMVHIADVYISDIEQWGVAPGLSTNPKCWKNGRYYTF